VQQFGFFLLKRKTFIIFIVTKKRLKTLLTICLVPCFAVGTYYFVAIYIFVIIPVIAIRISVCPFSTRIILNPRNKLLLCKFLPWKYFYLLIFDPNKRTSDIIFDLHFDEAGKPKNQNSPIKTNNSLDYRASPFICWWHLHIRRATLNISEHELITYII
jgi:hypothetical protein